MIKDPDALFWRRHKLRLYPDSAIDQHESTNDRTVVSLETSESIAAKKAFFDDLRWEAGLRSPKTIADVQQLCPRAFADASVEVRIEEKLDFNAGAWIEDGQRVIGLPIGAFLALEDLCLTLCCSPDFLMLTALIYSGQDEGELPYSIPMLGNRIKYRNRYNDYDVMANETFLNRQRLTYNLPTADWRLIHYKLLRDMALDWVLLHELGHHFQCHTDLLENTEAVPLRESNLHNALQLSELFDDEPETITIDMVRHCMELQADAFATSALLALWCDSDCRDQICADAGRAIAIDLAKNGDAGAYTDLRKDQRRRFVGVAAGVALLALDTLTDGASPSENHPSVQTRLLNFVNQLMIEAPFVDAIRDEFDLSRYEFPFENTDFMASFEKYYKNVIGPINVDLNAAATELGVPSFMANIKNIDDFRLALARNKVDGLEGVEFLQAQKDALSNFYSPWFYDLMLIMNGVASDELTSSAGRSFADLFPVQQSLNSKLAPLNQKAFGESLAL